MIPGEVEDLREKLRLVTTSYEMSQERMKAYRALLICSRSIFKDLAKVEGVDVSSGSLVEKYLETLDEHGV